VGPGRTCIIISVLAMHNFHHILGTRLLLYPVEGLSCLLKSKKYSLQKQPREYYSGKVLLGKTRLAMVYATKVTCRVKDIELRN
jgi:hypothetical protein